MKVLVTGGAGLIGAHLGRALQARGDEVIVVDDFNPFYDPRLKRARIASLLAPKTPVIEADVADASRMEAIMRDVLPDAVVHLAAWPGVRPSRAFPSLFASVNVLGTVNVLEASKKAGVHRVVFASSSSVYGPRAPVPSPEDSAGDQQVSGYGVSKRTGELYAFLYAHVEGLHVTCLRFFTVYGPWGRPDMAVWKFTRRILNEETISLNVRSAKGEEVRRDFTEVSDIVRGTIAALDKPVPFAVMNLGASDAVPLRRLVAALEDATGKFAIVEETVLPPEEAVDTCADLRRAKEALSFAPAVTIEEGAARFVRWYQEEFLKQFPDELQPSRYWQ